MNLKHHYRPGLRLVCEENEKLKTWQSSYGVLVPYLGYASLQSRNILQISKLELIYCYYDLLETVPGY